MDNENEAGVYAKPESRDQFRSSHHWCSVAEGFLKKIANFTAKHLCRSVFLKNLQAFRPRTPRTSANGCFFQFSVDRNYENS